MKPCRQDVGWACDSRRGFTLLELLIASVIVAVASAVILGGFAAGIRVWERAREFSGLEVASRIAMADVRKALCNRVPCRAIPFNGTAVRIEIPSIVRDAGTNLWPGSIRYEFNQGVMKRISKGITGDGSGKELSETLLSGVLDVSFAYGDAGNEGRGGVVWAADWTGRTNLPVAVRMGVRFLEGREQREMQQTVVLPRGYPVKDERY